MTASVKTVLRQLWRPIASCFLIVLLVAAVCPFVNAARFSGRIQAALESSLGRKVSFQEAHLTLLFGPGFSLGGVTIEEDPHFGAETFAYVPELQARLRLDRLIFGHVAFSSLRLVEPAVNLVRREDGAWNVVALVNRLSRPSRSPLNLFPAFTISGGRIDFKFGVRKTNVYVTGTDVSIYPERSGKFYVQFSGSPARTDRAGNGFGHLRGEVTWYVHPEAQRPNQLEASISLDRSNLSELSTLFQGEDAGLHGTITARASVAGPAARLRVNGEMLLEDLHRWDLLPSSGENWRVMYQGAIDLPGRRMQLRTAPPRSGELAPVALAMNVNEILARPSWSVIASLRQAPTEQLLPLARRMGMELPENLKLQGKLNGAIGYSNGAGWSGAVSIDDAAATLPGGASLRAATLTASVSPDRIHFEPARIEAATNGWLDLGGDYDRKQHGLRISFAAHQFPADSLQNLFGSWLGEPSALGTLNGSDITGGLVYSRSGEDAGAWSGKFDFKRDEMPVAGLAEPLTDAEGEVAFDAASFDLSRFSANLGKKRIELSYHRDLSRDDLRRRPDRLHFEATELDLAALESALSPALRPEGLLARLGVTRRTIPAWLAERNLQGDLHVKDLYVNGTALGELHSRVHWQGVKVQLAAMRLQLPQGEVNTEGTVSIGGLEPKYRFSGALVKFPWRGGWISADGRVEASGTGAEVLQQLAAEGSFSGQDVSLSADDSFRAIAGDFQLSFGDGWPNLRVTNLQASAGDQDWTGAAASQSDGILVLDLEHGGQQRRVVSTLVPENAPAPSSAASAHGSF